MTLIAMAGIPSNDPRTRIPLRRNASSIEEAKPDVPLAPAVLPTVTGVTTPSASTTDKTTTLDIPNEPSVRTSTDSTDQFLLTSSGASSSASPTPAPVPAEPVPEVPELPGLPFFSERPEEDGSDFGTSAAAPREEAIPLETQAPSFTNNEATETDQGENLTSPIPATSESSIPSKPESGSVPEPTSQDDGTFTGSDDEATKIMEGPPAVSSGAATESEDLLEEDVVKVPEESDTATEGEGDKDNAADSAAGDRQETSDDAVGNNDQTQEDDGPADSDVDVDEGEEPQDEVSNSDPEPSTSEREDESKPGAGNELLGDSGKGPDAETAPTGTAVTTIPTSIISDGNGGANRDGDLVGSGGKDNRLSGPQKAGIIAGSVIGAAILFGLIAYFAWYIRKRHRKYKYVIKTPMLEQPPTLGPVAKTWDFDNGSIGPTTRSARLAEAMGSIFKPTAASDRSSRVVDLSRGNSQFSTAGEPRFRPVSVIVPGSRDVPPSNGPDTDRLSGSGARDAQNQRRDPFADTNAITTTSQQPVDPFDDSQVIRKGSRLSLIPTWDPRNARSRSITAGSIHQTPPTPLDPRQPSASPVIRTRTLTSTGYLANATPPARTNIRSDQFDLEIAYPPAASIPPVPPLRRHDSYTSQVSSLSSYSQPDHQNDTRVSRYGEAL